MVPKSRGLIEGKAVKLPVDRKCTLMWSHPVKRAGNVSVQSRGYDLFREPVAARAHG